MAGRFVVITGPSASGKSTLAEALLKSVSHSTRLVTITTRQARPTEVDGVDYYFISRKEFETRLAKDEFFEHAEVYGNLYGSSRDILKELLLRFSYVFAVIDVQGAKTLKEIVPNAFTIFLHPGSVENITQRLIKERTHSSKEEIQERITTALNEFSIADSFDAVVENKEGEFESTLAKAVSLIQS